MTHTNAQDALEEIINAYKEVFIARQEWVKAVIKVLEKIKSMSNTKTCSSPFKIINPIKG